MMALVTYGRLLGVGCPVLPLGSRLSVLLGGAEVKGNPYQITVKVIA
jgi:hypothetical protein